MHKLKIHRQVLDCGLIVCVVPLNHLHRVHVSLTHNVGSRHEPPDTNGVSHFLEHIMFRGTRRLRTLTALAGAFEDIGGNLDGSTGREFTTYETYLPPERLGEGLQLLAEFVLDPRLVGVQLERRIILEELKMDLNDEGRTVDPDSISKRVLFGSHPLGQSVIGTPETLKAITRPVLRHHHQTYYCGANSVLSVVGKVRSPEDVLAIATEAFRTMTRGERQYPEPLPEPTKQPRVLAPRLEVVHNEGSVQTDVSVVFRGPSEHAPSFPALEILTRVVDDGLSTRLPRRMIDELGLAYSANGFFDLYRDTSVWSLHVTVSHRKIRRAVDELGLLLGELMTGDVEADEFERARNRTRWELTALLDSPRAVSGRDPTGDCARRVQQGRQLPTRSVAAVGAGRTGRSDPSDAPSGRGRYGGGAGRQGGRSSKNNRRRAARCMGLSQGWAMG
ncbi:MAG: pitrilysin family protein [Myxococcota bacterium]